MFSSTLIIALAFIPLFSMTGVAGVIFSPMAHTYAFAIGGAILLALTLTPVLAARYLEAPAGTDHEAHENALMRTLSRGYAPVFRFALEHKQLAVGISAAVVLLAVFASPLLGREFMPKLEEGNFWIRASLPVSVSLEQSSKYVGRMRAIVLGCPRTGACEPGKRTRPEVLTVVSQLGRPDDGTDPVGFYNIEIFAPLAEHSRWRRGVTKESLTEDLSTELSREFPGVVFNFSQVIADNVEEAMSGVKGENTVKVVGPDVKVDEEKAEEVLHAMSSVKGVQDLGVFRSLGQPVLRISPDRVRAGRYGLNVGDVGAIVQAAVGGQAVTQVYEGERHFDLVVRWAAQYRKDPNSIRDIPVPTPDGTVIPLAQLAEVVQEEGPSLIYREDIERYVPIKFSVRGRDLASTVAEAEARIHAAVTLPYDVHLEWAGEIDQLNETTGRLMWIVPASLVLIALIVYGTVKNWLDALVVLAGIPVACSGGILALLITGTTFSISAAMGFISIFGLAVQDALIVVTAAQAYWREGMSVEAGALAAAQRRLRPVLMTTSVAMLGLFPAAVSRGIGSETQRPLAIVVIGGALMLAVLPRLLQPALLVLVHGRERRHALPGSKSTQPAAQPA